MTARAPETAVEYMLRQAREALDAVRAGDTHAAVVHLHVVIANLEGELEDERAWMDAAARPSDPEELRAVG